MRSPLPSAQSCKLCAVITAFFPEAYHDLETLLEGFRVCREAGYEAVEFFFEGEYREEISRELRSLGLDSIFSPSLYAKMHGLKLASGDAVERRRAVKTMTDYIHIGMEYGAKQAMLISGPEPDESDIPEALSCLQESVGEICTHAYSRKEDFFITMETFNHKGEPYFLIGPTDRSIRFAQSVRRDHRNFGLTLDLSHLTQLREDQTGAVGNARSVCNHIHIANCVVSDPCHPLYGDKHPPLDYPKGDVDSQTLRSFVKRFLEDAEYHPGTGQIVGLEVITHDLSLCSDTAVKTKAYFNELMRGFEGGLV